MARPRRERPERRMKPVFMVFCEGQTEQAYVEMLRSRYRLPIEIRTKILGPKVSQREIERHLKFVRIGETDKVRSFLLYDLDVSDVVRNMRGCKATTAGSNPCIELWFILHSTEHRAFISSEDCVQRLRAASPEWSDYIKGTLSEKQKSVLWDHRDAACSRAATMDQDVGNPSTKVHLLIAELEKHKPKP